MNLPKVLEEIAKQLNKQGAKSIVVGGAVRDYLLKKEIKDIDVEVYSIDSYNELASTLSRFGKVNLVGKSFGVIKLKVQNLEFDFSLPRVESKVDKGHKGFKVRLNSSLGYKEAFRRRDFTINSIGYDILNREIIDPFRGEEDIKKSILRVVDSKSFIEDPLRVYRAVQFSARFKFQLERESFKLCRVMVKKGDLDELPKERIFEEFKKFLLKSDEVSIALELLKELKILEKSYQEFTALRKRDWESSLKVVDIMAKLKGGDDIKALIRMLSALVLYLKEVDRRSFLKKLTDNKKIIESVLKLTSHYKIVEKLFYKKGSIKDIRELAIEVNILELELIARADFFAKREDVKRFEAGEWLLRRASELNVLEAPLKAIISGQDLISLGLKPSPEFKEVLNKTYKAQLNDEFSKRDEAIEWVKKNILNKNS